MKFVIHILLLTIVVFVYAQEIPQVLTNLGLKDQALINYAKEADIEVFTFFDSRTTEPDDVVIFVLEAGEIKQEIKEDPFAAAYRKNIKKSYKEMEKSMGRFKEELTKEPKEPSYSDILGK